MTAFISASAAAISVSVFDSGLPNLSGPTYLGEPAVG
jgi:hypothetical protein